MNRYPLFQTLVLVFAFASMPALLPAQTLLNGDLNGTVGVSTTPTSWAQVPFTDPVSIASGGPQGTSDVTNATGPLAFAGIAGIPYSGTTLVTGLKMSTGGSTWHEGLQQTISGFTPGNSYQLSFWQAVVKQSNALDNTAAWDLFLDNTYIGMSAPSTSNLAYNNINLIWENRSINFTATAATHTIKLMPADDDNNWNGNNGLRMGIDAVSLSSAVVLPVTVSLDVIRTNAGARLSWSLPDGTQAERCVIQRSLDGQRFEPIAEQVVAGSHAFEYEDASLYSGVSYYRIAVDLLSGERAFSEIRTVSSPVDLELFVYNDVLHVVAAPGIEQQRIEIYSLNGTRVFEGQIQGEKDLSFLQAGMYLVKATIPGQENTVVRKKIRVGM